MQVKVCPKCSSENKESNNCCSSCYTSLDGVPVTEGKGNSAPAVSVPSSTVKPKQTVAAPRPAPSPVNNAPPPSPDGPKLAVGAYGRPAFNPRPLEPSGYGQRKRIGAGAWLMILIGITVLAYAGISVWQNKLHPKQLTPEQVVYRIYDVSSDYEKLRPYLTKASITAIIQEHGSESAFSQKLKDQAAFSTLAKMCGSGIHLKKVTMIDSGKAIAEQKLSQQTVDQMKALYGQEIKFELVLLKEDGVWKLDLPQTQERRRQQIEIIMRKRYSSGFNFRKFMQKSGGNSGNR